MRFAIFLLCLTGVPLIQCKQLHEYMTEEEVMSIFHKPHHLVPEYEVVPVLHRSKRQDDFDLDDSSEVMLKAFEEDIKLYLQPAEGILASTKTPVWTVKSDPQAPEGLNYRRVPWAMKSLGVTLQDVHGKSAVLLSPTESGRVLLDGILKNSLVIRSLPRRILKEVLYGGHNLYKPHYAENATRDDDFAYTDHHVVYKVPPSKGDRYSSDFMIVDPVNDGVERSAPDIIYPEVLLIIDHNEYKLLGRNIQQAVRYLVAFWNGVDLRYRLLTTPTIRFNIAGIIIALDNDALPYLEKNRVGLSQVDADRALRGMADYFYRESRFPTSFYDIAVTLTQLDMCNMLTEEYCDPSTLGYAYVAGACDRNVTKQSSEAMGIVEDNGGFSGIIPAAHEIGHLIGARHDGNAKNAGECEPYEGFIMTSGLMLHDTGFEWSTCSIDAFYKFINEDRAKCLYNQPVSGESVQLLLPGKLLSLDDQCKKVLGTKACNRNVTVCTRLECEYPGFEGFCTATAPAAEGSPCGEDLICLNGRCVLEGALTKEQDKKIWIKKHKFIPQFKKQAIKLLPWILEKLYGIPQNRTV